MLRILDSDHMSVLERGGAPALPLALKLETVPDEEIVTTIVNYEEQCKGWLAVTARAKGEVLIRAYLQLGQHLEVYTAMDILSYDVRAHAIFQSLQAQKIRIGTQDLKKSPIF
ncbi:MAG: type II toxin-antitoxin system VapC family toxin [bacterium]